MDLSSFGIIQKENTIHFESVEDLSFIFGHVGKYRQNITLTSIQSGAKN